MIFFVDFGNVLIWWAEDCELIETVISDLLDGFPFDVKKKTAKHTQTHSRHKAFVPRIHLEPTGL